ncbi:DUF6218 family protein [Actinokineospora fastidiosa]|uniref:Uncharacterized protein n=1 Tax=Actinokineospora fastidiosa TaxID=1816 RepID=A0A918LFS1_9PSEU|nr:DUF6218 family protein [Actinokineospora fastidiosa]GGS40842.1 hypothetical protein GCM10010171_39250 [Actinokineospora fastidiosa]
MVEEIAPVARTITTRAADGRTMIGHVVLCRDDDFVALWQVSADGLATGAWVVPVEEALGDAASWMVGCCAQRALIDVDPAGGVEILGELRKAAGVEGAAPRVVSLVDGYREIVGIRAACAEAVAERKQAKAVEWPVDLPEEAPTDLRGFQELARLPRPRADREVAAEALLRCAVTAWVLQRWKETVTAVRRRSYLQELAVPALVPPRWEAELCAAFAD